MNEHLSELWQLIFAEIRDSLPVRNKDTIANLWFGKIELRYMSGSKVYFSIENFLKKKFIEEHTEYFEGFKNAIRNILGFDPEPILICTERDTFENQFAELVTESSDEMKVPAVKSSEGEAAQAAASEASDSSLQTKPKYSASTESIYNDVSVLPPEAAEPSEKLITKPVSGGRTSQRKPQRRGIESPLRYNPESGRLEEMPLSSMVSKTDDDGVLILGKSIPPCYPSYTFENFVVGSSNRFAYQYALQASHYPAQQYNPLYIYGSPGLGKTHLLYAITNEIMALHPDYNIIYIKAEDFTTELVRAIQSKTPMQFFREKYRTADVLLIDDVQFIAGKDSTQEEFFHTYNALYDSGKQIIMTSDKAPKDIDELEERLRSRFEGGPIIKIDPPDIELRTAIIKKKFELMKIDIPNEVVMFLSENLRDNIRQIEGVIKKMNAYCLMCNEKITLSLAEKFISDIVTITSKIDGNKIVNSASEKYNIPRDVILGKSRRNDIAWARHMAIYVMKKLMGCSTVEIGKFFNRDHSTIMASIEKIKKLADTDPTVAREIQEFIDIVKLKA